MMSKKNMKKHILAVAVVSMAGAIMATNVSAAEAGPYIGGQIGYGNVHQGGFSNTQLSEVGIVSSNTSSDSGVAGRVFGGYQINQYFAAELGYSKFSNATAKTTVQTSPFSSATLDGTIKTYAVDLVGKAILPLQCGFNIYGKAGAAYLSETADVTATINTPGGAIRIKESDKESHVYPTFGAGVGYEVTKNIVADVSWNHIQVVGNSTDLKNTDLVAVGLSYNFG